MEQQNKPNFRPEYKSEVSMWGLDFQRFHEILKQADELRIRIQDSDFQGYEIRNYFARLETLYANLKILAYETTKTKLDAMQLEIENLIAKSETSQSKIGIPKALIIKLRRFHDELLMLKQVSGLGIKVTRNEDTKDKMKRLMTS